MVVDLVWLVITLSSNIETLASKFLQSHIKKEKEKEKLVSKYNISNYYMLFDHL